jgi:aspartyl-tRNA(Asn)/glutamyl-tRNA(Gln) amidotransferase subunit A
MPDLTREQVAALAAAAGLSMTADDVTEVTYRLAAFLEALTPLADLPLVAAEPTPFGVSPIPFGDGEARSPEAAPRAARATAGRSATTSASSADGGDHLAFASAVQLAALVRDKQVSPVELTRLYLERIERLDGRLRAYVTVTADAALEAARRAEVAVTRGEPLGPLHGVPIGVKDQFDTAGLRTTCGSRIFGDRVPSSDATAVTRLMAAGAILLGKQNLTEFAFGGTIEPPFGQPRNPWSLDHDPGMSSSGSGAATAAGLAGASLGEDTGGSVRIPAAWCGVVGLRPTWGLVSRHGSFPLCWSMDTAGPITRTVADAALMLGVLAGHDPADPLTSRRPVPDYLAGLDGGVRGLRVGLMRELLGGPDTIEEVQAATRQVARVLEGLGAAVDEVSIPLTAQAGAIFMAVADAEGAGLHQRWLRQRPLDYDRATRRRLLTVGLLPAALHHVAARARAALRGDMLAALGPRDLLLAPAGHRAAPTIAENTATVTSGAEAAGRFFTRRSYTSPAALAGIPAIAVPCGFSREGLPLSVQLMGRPFEDATVLRAAHAYEQTSGWHRRRPPL